MQARTASKSESRGKDGRGFDGPGFDHGVFFPFRIMFSDSFKSIPIVQASINGTLSSEGNLSVGRAVAKLREEGILIICGGLTIHNLGDVDTFGPDTTNPKARAFNDAVTQVLPVQDVSDCACVPHESITHCAPPFSPKSGRGHSFPLPRMPTSVPLILERNTLCRYTSLLVQAKMEAHVC